MQRAISVQTEKNKSLASRQEAYGCKTILKFKKGEAELNVSGLIGPNFGPKISIQELQI